LDFFPLDSQLQIWDGHWSEGVVRLAVWLGGLVSYEQAGEVFEQVGQVNISPVSIWRRVQKWGEEFREREQQRVEQANQVAGPVIRRKASKDRERMGIAMDGAMLNIVGEGWKELKMGCVFEIEQRPSFDKELLEWEEQGHAVHNSYTAYLGGPERFGQYAWAEAERRGWERAWETEAVGDGAVWIWNLVADHFYDSQQVVDWYHGTEHLGLSAGLIYREEESQAKRQWLKDQKENLFQGHAEDIAQLLQTQAGSHSHVREALREQAGYFEKNKRRMNYAELREEGWLIGSGMVESGAKQYKQRFTGPGMRWSREGAEHLIPVRSAIMSKTFDQFWHSVYNSPKN
jgi:hypothetical protein